MRILPVFLCISGCFYVTLYSPSLSPFSPPLLTVAVVIITNDFPTSAHSLPRTLQVMIIVIIKPVSRPSAIQRARGVFESCCAQMGSTSPAHACGRTRAKRATHGPWGPPVPRSCSSRMKSSAASSCSARMWSCEGSRALSAAPHAREQTRRVLVGARHVCLCVWGSLPAGAVRGARGREPGGRSRVVGRGEV